MLIALVLRLSSAWTRSALIDLCHGQPFLLFVERVTALSLLTGAANDPFKRALFFPQLLCHVCMRPRILPFYPILHFTFAFHPCFGTTRALRSFTAPPKSIMVKKIAPTHYIIGDFVQTTANFRISR
jgi:hypothetical protein